MTPVEEIPILEGEDKNASLPMEFDVKIDNIRGLMKVQNHYNIKPGDFLNEILAIYFLNTEIPELRSKI